MKTYKAIALKNRLKCYEKVNILTQEELENQYIFWNVRSFSELLQSWNRQIESPISKLKWIYYE